MVLNQLGVLLDSGEEIAISYDLFMRLTNSLFERCTRCVEQALTVHELTKESIDAGLTDGSVANVVLVTLFRYI